MRIAVLYFPPNNSSRALAGIARSLAESLEAAGHQVSIIAADSQSPQSLSSYGYIAIGAESASFLSRDVCGNVSAYLSQAGMISGKRCFAFLRPRGIFAQKALNNLMTSMESEGMFIRYSEIIKNSEQAAATAQRLQIE